MTAHRLMAVAVLLPLILGSLTLAEAKPGGKGKGKAHRAVTPKTGVYSAEPVKPKGDFQLGAFEVVRDRSGTRIVSIETMRGIYYPNVSSCRVPLLPLRADVVPVRRSGRFRIREVRQTAAGRLVVRWRGRWIKPGKVRGRMRIKLKRCEYQFRWIGRRLPPTKK